MNYFLEVKGLGVLIVLWLFVAFGVPLILLVAGIVLRKKNKKKSKKFLIAAVVYVIIGLGICGGLMI